MTSLAIFAITVYVGQYVGQPLFCDTDGTLFYDDTTPPWAALPDWFWDAGGKCWDDVAVMIDGTVYVYAALDKVKSGDWYVTQPGGVLLPLGVDIPEIHAPFDALSMVGRVWNLEPIRRRWSLYQ